MLIKETTVFSRRVQRLLDPESYRLLQLRLAADPEAGSLIPGTGGLRKIRWRAAGRGKRGGVRVIYYFAGAHDTILLLMMFAKNERSDLTREQKAILRRIVEEEYP
ncbi:MAG: type II toxin-antitoxin system RelE/ParE family toxin [Candidatus Palauibacterales bacterium]|nr:type II toxin-antitoxin system RelE/ParE family toxin [Candidatus Palauibacterales bacterium]